MRYNSEKPMGESKGIYSKVVQRKANKVGKGSRVRKKKPSTKP